MRKITPPKYVAYKEFNEFKRNVNSKFDNVDEKFKEVNMNMVLMETRINTNVLELFKIGLTPLYKKLHIKLPEQFNSNK